MFTQSYSKSELKRGELIESETDKYSGPSNVLTLSYNGFLRSFILLILVFLFMRQNCGEHDTLINELWSFLGYMNLFSTENLLLEN